MWDKRFREGARFLENQSCTLGQQQWEETQGHALGCFGRPSDLQLSHIFPLEQEMHQRPLHLCLSSHQLISWSYLKCHPVYMLHLTRNYLKLFQEVFQKLFQELDSMILTDPFSNSGYYMIWVGWWPCFQTSLRSNARGIFTAACDLNTQT